jgi:hypothetical protein
VQRTLRRLAEPIEPALDESLFLTQIDWIKLRPTEPQKEWSESRQTRNGRRTTENLRCSRPDSGLGNANPNCESGTAGTGARTDRSVGWDLGRHHHRRPLGGIPAASRSLLVPAAASATNVSYETPTAPGGTSNPPTAPKPTSRHGSGYPMIGRSAGTAKTTGCPGAS